MVIFWEWLELELWIVTEDWIERFNNNWERNSSESRRSEWGVWTADEMLRETTEKMLNKSNNSSIETAWSSSNKVWLELELGPNDELDHEESSVIERFWECLTNDAATEEINIKVCKTVNIKMYEVVQLTLFAESCWCCQKRQSFRPQLWGLKRVVFLLCGVKAGFS